MNNLNNAETIPVALTIAGSDSGGQAGIQTDLLTFNYFRVHGCTAITALTAQNPFGVTNVQPANTENLKEQLNQLFSAYQIDAVKTGMLVDEERIQCVIEAFEKYQPENVVIDPVMISTSGTMLLEKSATAALKKLFKFASLITPNLPEAEFLLNRKIENLSEMKQAANDLAKEYNCNILLKGGHLVDTQSTDVHAVIADGQIKSTELLETPLMKNPLSTHGTGCCLSAAIAALMAKNTHENGGKISEKQMIMLAKTYVCETIKAAKKVGKNIAARETPDNVIS